MECILNDFLFFKHTLLHATKHRPSTTTGVGVSPFRLASELFFFLLSRLIKKLTKNTWGTHTRTGTHTAIHAEKDTTQLFLAFSGGKQSSGGRRCRPAVVCLLRCTISYLCEVFAISLRLYKTSTTCHFIFQTSRSESFSISVFSVFGQNLVAFPPESFSRLQLTRRCAPPARASCTEWETSGTNATTSWVT